MTGVDDSGKGSVFVLLPVKGYKKWKIVVAVSV
jgi:hypothetical protein